MHNAMVSLFAATVLLVAPGSNWPEYRGPAGDGHADSADLPVKIDESVVRWKTPIHGKGWSSPVVWGDQIWLTTATEDGKEMSVICVDRDNGNVVHDKVVKQNAEPAFCHPMNSYATPTPVVESGRVYVHFGSYLTACLDTESAEVLWRREDLECDHHRGPASSPILFDGKLFIAYDGFDQQYVIALDAQTGKTVWKKQREIDYGTDNGDRMKAYCTGHVIDVAGEKQLVYPSAVATIAYAPDTGETLWTVYHDGMNASARPLYGEGLLFLTNGMGSMVAVSPDGTGDLTASHVAWSAQKSVAKKSSPLLVDGVLYMNSDDGIVSARDAKTGEMLWQRRAGGSFAASPVFAGGRIYLFNTDGETFTIQPGDTYQLLAEGKLGDGFMASPAIVDDQLILRSKSHLYLIEK
ncbi:PQQ-binding-like beta-propeller repeat protein [Roseiconus nitratireducens]|uniref:PQQ-binding-like beta-propeller repeat protein n=1 Tax=Roseiconus nitratireducens TaxID=2605748 RepID=A0A5M6DCX8_9BACT|nr:PQQ-binding-like beta-propeller repeat protein [Roseiconus nitratireducens]KAA5543025.1 PQQ-binding-like beta-propeller repeat protein [Roseiconus nitratireducens]